MASSEVPIYTPEQRKNGIPPRVTPSEVPIETHEKRKPGKFLGLHQVQCLM